MLVREVIQCHKKLIIDHHNKPERTIVGGKECNFRSQGEKKLAQYLELLKQLDFIDDWFYEFMNFKFPPDDPDMTWLVDFTVKENNGSITYWEYKGWFEARDRKKLQLLSKYYPQAKVVYVFPNKSSRKKMKTSEKYCHRVCVLYELTRGIL
jgi:hypothetical protein